MARLFSIILEFLVLGCSSFGGPVAHLGFFYERFVQRQRWLSDAAYAELTALCQTLPGPSSSQVCIGLGLIRAGWAGAVAAWLGFTLPSALLMLIASASLSAHPEWLQGGWVHGLKVAAVAVVAQAVLGMQRRLAPDRQRATLMVASAVLVLLVPRAWAQLLALFVGAIAGLTLLRPDQPPPSTEESLLPRGRRWPALVCLGLFVLLLLSLPWLTSPAQPTALRQLAGFLQAGSLVFGGGHVVLPLLEQVLVAPGWISSEQFMAGYGLAQAVPGPMFSFAAFLGFDLDAGLHGVRGGLAALIALFAPAFLLIGGLLPFWSDLSKLAMLRRALVGVNAAVVGVLLAALYQPVWQLGIRDPADFSLGISAFLLMVLWKQPAWRIVALCAAVGGLWLAPVAL